MICLGWGGMVEEWSGGTSLSERPIVPSFLASCLLSHSTLSFFHLRPSATVSTTKLTIFLCLFTYSFEKSVKMNLQGKYLLKYFPYLERKY